MRVGLFALLLIGACARPVEDVVIPDRDGKPSVRLRRAGEAKDGPATLYWPTGEVRLKGLYANDRRVGWWGGYLRDGHWHSWTHYRNGLKDGLRVYWDSLGRVVRTERFAEGKHNGLFVRRSADGRIAQCSTYADDLLEGPHIQWYDDRGGSVVKGQYHKDRPDGLWTEYDTTGRMIWQGVFKAGVVERMLYGKRRRH